MEDLAGIAVRVTPDRHQANEWAVLLAADNIPHRLRFRPDGWALLLPVTQRLLATLSTPSVLSPK